MEQVSLSNHSMPVLSFLFADVTRAATSTQLVGKHDLARMMLFSAQQAGKHVVQRAASAPVKVRHPAKTFCRAAAESSDFDAVEIAQASKQASAGLVPILMSVF